MHTTEMLLCSSHLLHLSKVPQQWLLLLRVHLIRMSAICVPRRWTLKLKTPSQSAVWLAAMRPR